jgi:hypothetical protein
LDRFSFSYDAEIILNLPGQMCYYLKGGYYQKRREKSRDDPKQSPDDEVDEEEREHAHALFGVYEQQRQYRKYVCEETDEDQARDQIIF